MNNKYKVIYKKNKEGQFIRDLPKPKPPLRGCRVKMRISPKDPNDLLCKYFYKWYNYTFLTIKWL
jgi:hypothetical protein